MLFHLARFNVAFYSRPSSCTLVAACKRLLSLLGRCCAKSANDFSISLLFGIMQTHPSTRSIVRINTKHILCVCGSISFVSKCKNVAKSQFFFSLHNTNTQSIHNTNFVTKTSKNEQVECDKNLCGTQSSQRIRTRLKKKSDKMNFIYACGKSEHEIFGYEISGHKYNRSAIENHVHSEHLSYVRFWLHIHMNVNWKYLREKTTVKCYGCSTLHRYTQTTYAQLNIDFILGYMWNQADFGCIASNTMAFECEMKLVY